MDHLLLQLFDFRRPIEFEDIPEGHEVIAKSGKTVIRSDQESLTHDLPELLSMAKLAEKDPLLITFFFQKGYSEEEARYMRMFQQLCQPLQTSWTWQVMKKYAPDVYEKEIAETYEMWEKVYEIHARQQKTPDDSSRQEILGLWAILKGDPKYNVILQLKTDKENRADWEAYMKALESYISVEPSINHYIAIAQTVNSPYEVRLVKDDEMTHYHISLK